MVMIRHGTDVMAGTPTGNAGYDPGDDSQSVPQGTEVFWDENPNSRHTYDSMVVLPGLNLMWAFGGSLYSGSGGGSVATWTMTLGATPTWTRRTDSTILTGASLTAYDNGKYIYTLSTSTNGVRE